MTNPFTAFVNFLIARPNLSHAVVAFGETLALAIVGILISLPHPEILAAIIVSTFYYGREAGQQEHDLKSAGVDPFLAFAGAEFGFLWTSSNLVQWLTAIAGSAAMAAILLLLR